MRHPIVRLLLAALAPSFGSTSCFLEPKAEKAPFGYDRAYDYLSLLKSSPPYAYEPTAGYPEFTYQEPTDENLSELRTAYELERVAGDGDELSRIVNLLRWAHQSLRHNGGVGVQPENSLAILRHHQQTSSGVNCVMMAIVLNEAYLATGFRSRVIHGNGRDWVFNGEWHTFNAVYSNTLNKWLFVDPMNQAYFTDDRGTPLSVAEVRGHLRQDAPLYLNADADYNGQPVNAEDYLHYLSKNLYRFSASLHSAFGNYWLFHLPEGTTRTYFHLDPRGQRQEGLGGPSTVNYFTSNPDHYWTEP